MAMSQERSKPILSICLLHPLRTEAVNTCKNGK